MSTLVIGAAGAVGKRLVNALVSRNVPIIAADRMPRLPNSISSIVQHTEGNVDVRSVNDIRRIFQKHPNVECVWNLAAPLSLETAMDPKLAEAVTIGGMSNVLEAMTESNVRKICFTDSIGSFGATAPRQNCTARWLIENPDQDPGSAYGLQKRGCRTLMQEFAKSGGDPRFAVLPGVLHSAALWGAGTTEYALEMMLAAVQKRKYQCNVDPDVMLPMIYVDDLMRGLVALQTAPEDRLLEPEKGYAIPGLSFTANELAQQISKYIEGFEYEVQIDPNANKFANLWPDTLSPVEAKRDLGYQPEVKLPEMVTRVLAAHMEREAEFSDVFRAIDKNVSGGLARPEVESYLTGLLDYEPSAKKLTRAQRESFLKELTDAAFADIAPDHDRISVPEWLRWSRSKSLKLLVSDFLKFKSTHQTMTGF